MIFLGQSLRVFFWPERLRDLFFWPESLGLGLRGCMIFFAPTGCMICFGPRGCVIFFGPERLRNFFGPERLRYFFLAPEFALSIFGLIGRLSFLGGREVA